MAAIFICAPAVCFGAPAQANTTSLVVAEAVPLPRPNPILSPRAPVAAVGDPAASQPEADTEASEPAQQTASAIASPAKPEPLTSQRSIFAEAAFRIAIKLFDQGDANAALAASYALPDPIDAKIIKWLAAVYKYRDVPAISIDAISRELSDWPGQRLLRIRFEQALELEDPSAEAIVAAFGDNQPVTDDGTLLLARAFLATGQKARAAALIRKRWREERLDDDFEDTVREEFGDLLTKADHKIRMDRMLYEKQTAKALRAAEDHGGNQPAIAKAVIAVIKGDGKADEIYEQLPAADRKDPVALYSRIQFLRRAEKFEAAAELMLAAPREPAAIVDGDAWWVERRVLARELLATGDYRKAYRIAAGHSAESSAMRADAEFHAGWIALEFLKEPETAKPHFTVIQTVSTRPLSQSRAEYWLGRAAAAAGDETEATRPFRLAGAYPTTFYGQLALARLGTETLPLAPYPKADADTRRRFAELELVQVMVRLSEIKKDDRKMIFVDHLAETLTDPTHVALLIEMIEQEGNHNLALRLGKTAAYSGIPVDALAFPVEAIPASAAVGEVNRALVYAVARQESAFHTGAVSPAGARGLLQLMPGTARQMAKRAGVSYSKAKLTADAAYNAELGSHFLDHLLDRFNGSYVMTFAAYNAGPSRVRDWVEQNGDPRDADVDVVNWIELIPFTETRNYVQRIMENFVVYRARLGSPELTIEADLKRGG